MYKKLDQLVCYWLIFWYMMDQSEGVCQGMRRRV